MELVIPTIQTIVIKKSTAKTPTGVPKVFVWIRMLVAMIAKIFWVMNLGQGLSCFMSSTRPTIAIKTAGTRIVTAKSRVLLVSCEMITAPKVTNVTPITIATPPK